jgi:1,4-alpha-glucan branching enzyme
MFGHPGKKLNFMGGEFGQTREWNHDHSLDWHLLEHRDHEGLQQLVKDLNRLYRTEPSLHALDVRPEGFAWIDCNDLENSVVSFLRRSADPADFTVFVLNFTPVVRPFYRLGVPEAGHYLELLNTDADVYGGSNVGNQGGVDAEDIQAHGYEHSVSLTMPPLSCLVLKPERPRAASRAGQGA